MKKTALTIGLFSLVMVATSFTTAENVNNVSNEIASINPPTFGSSAGGGRKIDMMLESEKSLIEIKQSSFANVNQSLSGNKKQD